MEQPFGGEGFMSDPLLERELKSTPQKYTIHCTGFLFLMFAALIFCKWVNMRLNQTKNEDSQLDIMMKK